MRPLAAAAMSVVFASLSFAVPAHAQSSGIQSLIAVAQMKAENANDEALEGANRQRDLVRQQQQIRANQRALEDARNNQIQPVGACRTCIVQSTSNDDEDDD